MKITENASKKIVDFVQNEGSYALRISVEGGGCSGFSYGFYFADKIEEDDTVVEGENGAIILLDPISLMYLSEVTVDYVEGIQGSMFKIDNPLVTTKCGCGHSFGI